METLGNSKIRTKKCAAKQCDSFWTSDLKHNLQINMHCFPRAIDQQLKWLEACDRLDLRSIPTKNLCKNFFLCSKHFSSNCYNAQGRLKGNMIPNLQLLALQENNENMLQNDEENQEALLVECSSEELSSAQVNHRKKQLDNLLFIQETLQNYLNDVNTVTTTTDTNSMNGGTVMSNLTNLPKDNSTNVVKIAGMEASSSQYLQLVLPKKAGETNESRNAKRKHNTRNKSPTAAEPPAKKQNTTSSQPSLTHSLRATRKATGSLPNPCVNYSEEPEIEVIQERRVVTLKSPGGSTSLAGFRKISPKDASISTANRAVVNRNETVNRNDTMIKNDTVNRNDTMNRSTTMNRSVPVPATVPKRYSKPNNLFLLNINVRPRNAASVVVNAAKRKDLDAQVKVILMKSASEFVEYLLKQGLIRSEQYCLLHKGSNQQPAKLKLGTFQDPKVLASSGGYVWVGDCCSKKYISVFSGSIFGHTPVDKVQPTCLLKLVYHWSCQTSITNVETWVKVDKQFISKVYNYFRCICSVILHDKIYDFGFDGSKIELGIVSLGTTTADGSKKAVKVEILGLYDRKNKSYRLFASTPEAVTNAKERFLRILKPVKEVVHRNAVIICDQSVDPSCLNNMNFMKVEVCKTSDDESNLTTNSTIMFYLRKHVPKMFQAALSQLTENQVQLSLDELCWREKFASTSALCFSNLLDNITYLTFRELENPGLLPLLDYVADNPHSNFRYKNQAMNKAPPSVPTTILIAPNSGPLVVIPTQHADSKVANPMNHSNKMMIKNIQYSKNYLNTSVKNVASTTSTNYSSKNINPPVPIIKNNFTQIQRSTGNKLTNNLVRRQAAPAPTVKLETASEILREIEPYFYGRIEGNANWGQDQNISVFKCHICSDTFDDNVNFYAHIKYHIEGVTADKAKLEYICPYCNKYFEFINTLNKHKIDVHLMSDLTQLWCRICSDKFANEAMFKSHMTKVHVEAELPYRCEICHFATSIYYEIINHFNKSHRGTPYVQCHLCLTIKTITPNGSMSFSTRLFQHLHKHSQTKLSCSNCRLTFYSKYLLNEHKKEHLSCANVNGVARYVSLGDRKKVYFCPSTSDSNKTQTPVSLPTKSSQIALSLTVQDYSNVSAQFNDSKFYCIECDAPLHMENHFKKYRKCTRCAYSTCCPNMIMRHAQIFHPIGSFKSLNYFIGAPVPLPTDMFCHCGFSTKSGHHMANHLVKCAKTSAYVTHEANEASGSNSGTRENKDSESMAQSLPLTIELADW